MRLVSVYRDDGSIATGAVDFLYALIAERMTEPSVNISATMPSLEEHRGFVRRMPYRFWYLIENDDYERIGYVSATGLNEIGIVLLKAHRGKGHGPWAVKELMRLHEPLPAVPSQRRGCWLANVAPNNRRSKGMFKALGGKLIQVTYEL